MNFPSYLTAVLSLLFCTSALSMTLEEAGKALTSNNKETLQLAEKTIKSKGWESLHILNPMMFSGDLALETKARHLRRWIMFGLNNDIPEETRSKLLSFNSLELEDQEKIIWGLRKLDIAQPVAMACLHSRVLDLTIDAASLLKLKKAAKDILLDSLRKRAVGIDTFAPRLLHPETRAIIFNHLAKNNIDRLFKPYLQWFQLDPSIRFHLDRTAVKLDITRMVRTGRQREALTLLSGIIDPSALSRVIYEVKAWQRKGTQFPLNELTLDESKGYLELLHDVKKLTDTSKPYQLLYLRHPSLPQKLRPQLRIHEVIRLLNENEFYKAFDFSMGTLHHKNVQRVGLEELGEWAAKHQELLTKGLPNVQLEFHDKLYPFTSKLAPMNDRSTLAEREQSARLFNMLDLRTAKEGMWLSIVRKHSPPYLYIHTMALRKKLDDVVSDFEEKKSNNQERVGTLLGLKPEFAKQIKVAKHPAKTLQTILTGVWYTGTNTYQKLLLGNELATTWETNHPNLLKKTEHRGLIPLLALRLWNKGEYGQAIELLATDTRNTYQNSYFLAEMLNTVAEIDLHKLLSPISIPTEFIGRLIKHIQEDSTVKPQQIKHALILSSIYANRSDSKPGAGFNLYKSRQQASSLWLNGETDLAYDVMEAAFWNGSDPEESRMGLFPELALALGRIDAAIIKARKSKSSNDSHTLKLAYLLRAAGKKDAAFKLSQDFPKSKLHLQLCLETQNWQAAAIAIAHKKRDPNYTYLMRTWYNYLHDDSEEVRKKFNHSNIKSQWLTLLLGNYTEAAASMFKPGNSISIFQEKPLLQTAREHILITHCEEKLLNIAETEGIVPYQTMRAYFNYAAYLPNKDISSSIAVRLGKIPTCNPQMGNAAGWAIWAHKAMAVNALAKLGRTDLVKQQLKHMFAHEKDFSVIPEWHRKILMQGICHPIPQVPEEIVKLTQLENPNSSLADRLTFLAETFAAPDRLASVKQLLTLTRKHQQQFSRQELEKLTSLYSQALNQNSLRKNDLTEKPNPLDALELVLGKHPPVSLPYPTHNRASGKRTMTPAPGKNIDPRMADFKIIDGVNQVKSLWNQNQKDQARTLIKDITVRIILDEKFVSNDIRIRVRQGGWSSKFGEHPPIMAMICCDLWNMPAEITLPWAKTLTRIPTRYADHDRYKWATNLAITAGDHPAALTYYLQHANSLIHDTNYANVAQLVARLHDLKLIDSVDKNDKKKTLYHLRQRMQLDPYDTQLLVVAVKKLQSKGETETVKKIDSIITTFWENKLLRLAGYPPYKNALTEWKSTILDATTKPQ